MPFNNSFYRQINASFNSNFNGQVKTMFLAFTPEPDYKKSETAAITVTILRNFIGESTVRLYVSGGKETNAENYGLGANFDGSGTWVNDGYELNYTEISFGVDDYSKTVTLTVVNNPIPEPDRAMTVYLAAPSMGSVIGGPRTVTIVDDNLDAIYSLTDLPAACPIGGCAGWGGAAWNLVNDGATDNRTAFYNLLEHIRTEHGGTPGSHDGAKCVLHFDQAGEYLFNTEAAVLKIPCETNVLTFAGPVDGREDAGYAKLSMKEDYTNLGSSKLFSTSYANYYYLDDNDSHRLAFVNLRFDGRNKLTWQANYQEYGLETCHLMGLSGNTTKAGRTGIIMEACQFERSTAAGVSVVANVDIALYELRGENNFKGIATFVGGNTKANLRNIWTGGIYDPGVFWAEVADGGLGYNNSVDIEVNAVNIEAPHGGFCYLNNHVDCTAASYVNVDNLVLGEAVVLPGGDGAQLPITSPFGDFRKQTISGGGAGKVTIANSDMKILNYLIASIPGEIEIVDTVMEAYAVETRAGGKSHIAPGPVPLSTYYTAALPKITMDGVTLKAGTPHAGYNSWGFFLRGPVNAGDYPGAYINFVDCVFDESLQGGYFSDSAGGLPVTFDGCEFNVSNGGDCPAIFNNNTDVYMAQIYIKNNCTWNLGGLGASGKKIRIKLSGFTSTHTRYSWIHAGGLLTKAENDGAITHDSTNIRSYQFAEVDASFTITAVVKGAETTITAPGHTLQVGDVIIFDGFNPATNLEYFNLFSPWYRISRFTVQSVSGDDFVVRTAAGAAIDSSGYADYVPADDEPVVFAFPLRTITGDTGDNPVTARPGGFTGDRYIAGSNNYFCKSSGKAGVAEWEAY